MTHRTLCRPANEALLHALEYAYRDRRARKRDMRKLWIARINAASRSQGMPYNQFMHGLKLAGVNINRKMLADLAVRDAESFSELIAVAKGGPKSQHGGQHATHPALHVYSAGPGPARAE